MAQNTAVSAVSGQSLAVAIANPGALGTIEAYITAVNQQPLLSAEAESELANRYRATEDLTAARDLVLSHLRLVVKVARQYMGYGLPHADLIQEGNIGLMKAVKRFDPDRGVRLMSFAVHWIRAEIHEYVVRNWRLVKIATTKAQRKLFFNLRSMRQDNDTLSSGEVARIADELDVRQQDVRDMELRLSGAEMALEGREEDDYTPQAWLSDDSAGEPTRMLELRDTEMLQSEHLQEAIASLDDRSRRIIEARWLADDKGATLHELAAEYGVSAERIRQIEARALRNLREALSRWV